MDRHAIANNRAISASEKNAKKGEKKTLVTGTQINEHTDSIN